LPGVYSFAIGSSGTSLALVSIQTMAAKGWLQQTFGLAGLPLGVPIYLQAGVLQTPAYTLPLVMSNVAYGVVVN
jgi:hypothetical protein